MNTNAKYGPWTTSLGSSSEAELSTFWKRRLALLSAMNSTAPGLHRRAVVFLAAVALIALAWPTWQLGPKAGESPAPPEVEFLPRPSEQEAKIYAELEKPTDAAFLEEPLGNVITFISDLHKFPIILDQAVVHSPWVDAQAEVTLNVSGVKLQSALKLMLEPLSLTYVVEDGVMKITTTEAAERNFSARIYPVADLLGPDKDFQPLIETIQKAVPSAEWQEERDGSGGTITPNAASKSLVVKQTFRVHTGILALLRNLREAQKKPAAKKSAAN